MPERLMSDAVEDIAEMWKANVICLTILVLGQSGQTLIYGMPLLSKAICHSVKNVKPHSNVESR